MGTWLRQPQGLRILPTSLIRVATTAAQDSITAPTMGTPVITEIGMGAQPIGMTVQGVPTVHEGVPPTGMMGPEAQPDGAAARHRGIRARVTSADIGEVRRAGAADRARGTAPVVARVRGGVELPWTCEKAGFARKL